MDPFRILAGILLVLLGRRLFWLFVGLSGFWAGMTFATRVLPAAQSQWMHLVLAMACGIIGVLLALFLQRLAIAIGGFLAGGYFGLSLATQLGWTADNSGWMIFLIAGFLGAVFLSLIFDWALVFLSSAIGAALLVEGVHASQPYSLVLYAGLLILGIVVQRQMLRPHPHPARPN